METTQTQHMTLIVFGGALLAAVVVAVVVFVIPADPEDDPLLMDDVLTETTAPVNEVVTTTFNTSVLENPKYQELDNSLFIRGLLPVNPPTGTGKTNLFR
jgi:hypothetical protein